MWHIFDNMHGYLIWLRVKMYKLLWSAGSDQMTVYDYCICIEENDDYHVIVTRNTAHKKVYNLYYANVPA